jgi:hypothetical protein
MYVEHCYYLITNSFWEGEKSNVFLSQFQLTNIHSSNNYEE